MTDKELVAVEIRRYIDLLRVKQAIDKETELNNQLMESRIKLESFGVAVDNISLN